MSFKLCHFKSSDKDCTDNVGFQVVFCQLSFFSSLSPFRVPESSLPSRLFNSLFLLSLILDWEPFKCSAQIWGRINCLKLTVFVAHCCQARRLQPQKKQEKTDTILMHLCRQSHRRKLQLPAIVYKFLDIEIFL